MSNVDVITPLFTPYPSCSMSDISDEDWDSLIEGTPLPDVKELLDFYAEGGSMIPFPYWYENILWPPKLCSTLYSG